MDKRVKVEFILGLKKTDTLAVAEGQCAHARARSSQEQHQIREM